MQICLRNAFVALAIVAVPRALFGADGVTPASGTAATEATAAPTFEVDIRPILRTHCFDCHGANDEKQGNLDLRLVRFQLAGGDSGPAIAPGDPDHSHLLARIRAGEMPPGEGKVTAKEIDTIARWIAGGAKTARPEPESIPPGVGISVEERSWWAFQPLARPAVPESQPADPRVRGPIDALLKAAMPSGLSFAADADKRVLIRRASFDLLGLPPQPDEVEAFVADQSPDAYERLLDRLLASPHYGERWARHWLDAAGYADSEGATVQDAIRTWSYKYRDYVIRSLNADKPFDRFIHEQLAGDELAGPISGDMTAEQIELLTATGFLRMAADGTGSGDNSPEARNQVVTDTLKIVTSSLLGVSVACAQCHDHRYDPVPQTDYYALRAVFEPALDYQAWKVPAERDVSLYTAADRQKAADIEAEAQKIAAERAPKEAAFMTEAVEKELMKFEEPLRSELRTAYNTAADKRSDAQKQLLDKHPSVNITPGVLYQYNQAAADELKKFDERMANVRSGKPPQEFLRALVEPAAHTPETRLFYRGDYRQPKQSIGPGALSVCGPDSRRAEFASKSDSLPSSGRRLALARWLTGADNPLTARVLANRVWLHHFGRGIVTTPGDFGRLGTLPTHPALLDWLAVEFRESGWSLKKLHKTIMLSTAYRQSSRRDTAQAALDSDNRYYGRQNVVRLDAEALRDRVLAANGKLDRTLFGAPVAIKEDDAGQVILAGDVQRRSLYAMQRRSQPVALMQAFDAPAMQTNCEARASSTVATQSLMLMNGDFWLTQAGALAERAQREPTADLQAELVAGLTPRWLAGPPTWQFGYGACDTASGRTTFTALPHWTNSSWQGGEKLPDEKTGWVLVHADGGHPGANPDHAAIRRWTAPVGGVLTVQGTLGHSSENGDGVRGRVVSSTLGIAGEWSVRHGEAATNVERIVVARGDAIDFVTDCVGDVNADSFTWRVTLSLAQEGGETATFASHEGFHGPPSQSEAGVELASVVRAWQLAYLRLPTRDELSAACAFLDAQINYLRLHPGNAAAGRSPETQALANLCQALVSSNEFLYVD